MSGRHQIVMAGADARNLTKLAEYEAVGGYQALAKARGMTPGVVTDELLASELRGRGGAFFPTGRKWSFVPKPDQNPNPHYLVVNADESEPGSFKDNEILSRVPHRFIEGCLITAQAVEAKSVYIYIRGEYFEPYEILVAALEELTPELRGDVTIVVHRGAGAYICGEETALLDSLEGKRGQPRTKPPFPAIAGLYASPTVVNNVETIATVPPVIAMGGAEYAKLGVENSRGTRLVSVSGHVARGGNFEIEPGVTLHDLIYADDLGGGVPGGHALKAVIPGGSSTVILKANEIDVGYDFDSLLAVNTAMGSAGVIALDERVCMVQLGIRVSEFYEHESCGKCTPCREGTRWMTTILRKLEAGDASENELDLLLSVCDRINGKCLCPLGDTAAMAVASYVDKFRDEFVAHLDGEGCPFHDSPLEGVLAPIAQHGHSQMREWLVEAHG
jgi:NADH-quinone oxidoreductase subunit F